MNRRPEVSSAENAKARNFMSDRDAIKASLKAAHEADDRLDVAIRHSEKIGALPPDLMSGQRDLYNARRLLSLAISHFKESAK